jgi:hypothetical protein
MRRGDNIPSVTEYAHWNEEAEAMWYAENRYDMEHWDEEVEDDEDDRNYEEPEPDIFETFEVRGEAQAFFENYGPTAHSLDGPRQLRPGDPTSHWYVEGFSTELYESWTKRRRERRRHH